MDSEYPGFMFGWQLSSHQLLNIYFKSEKLGLYCCVNETSFSFGLWFYSLEKLVISYCKVLVSSQVVRHNACRQEPISK